MCEVVRTLIHNGYFKKETSSGVSQEAYSLADLKDNYSQILPKIKCAKANFEGNDEPPGICAVNGGS